MKCINLNLGRDILHKINILSIRFAFHLSIIYIFVLHYIYFSLKCLGFFSQHTPIEAHNSFLNAPTIMLNI